MAELKQGKDLNREDKDILCDSQLRYTAAYILSLGVVDANRYAMTFLATWQKLSD